MQYEPGQCPRMAHDFDPPVSLTATVSVDVQIFDIAALVAAARERYVENNADASDLGAVLMDAKAIIPDGDVSTALRMLFDPGVSPKGFDVLECGCEVHSRRIVKREG